MDIEVFVEVTAAIGGENVSIRSDAVGVTPIKILNFYINNVYVDYSEDSEPDTLNIRYTLTFNDTPPTLAT
jgi:hypothetical protein